jgi:integrase
MKQERTWDDVTARWLQENKDKRDYDGDVEKIEWLKPYFGGKKLSQIDGDLIYDTIEKHKADVSGATRNRYLALVRAIMRRAAFEWKWIESNQVPHARMNKESEGRTRYLEPEEFKRLMQELPEHWRSVVAFAVATGLRQSNVVKLRWAWVDLDAGHLVIPGSETKNGKPLGIPLNNLAMAVLRREEGKHDEFVFTNKSGKPVGKLRGDVWNEAKKRAGIEDFRFHDLRHCWASWLAQHGAPERHLQEMGGWKKAKMVERYATLRSKHLAPTASIIDRLLPADALLTVAAQ